MYIRTPYNMFDVRDLKLDKYLLTFLVPCFADPIIFW